MSKDIADRLKIQRGSVTSALKALADKGYINYEPYSYITLTPRGQATAKDIAYRHRTLKTFLVDVLQVDPETAELTACRMEHAIDIQTLERLTCFLDYIATCPRVGNKWLDCFRNFCTKRTCTADECRRCIEAIEPPE